MAVSCDCCQKVGAKVRNIVQSSKDNCKYFAFSPQSRICRAVSRTSSRTLRGDESHCHNRCNDTLVLPVLPCLLSPLCYGNHTSKPYLTTRVNTGVPPSGTVTYTFKLPIGGICGAFPLGKSSAVNRYSIPFGRAREATALALALIIG